MNNSNKLAAFLDMMDRSLPMPEGFGDMTPEQKTAAAKSAVKGAMKKDPLMLLMALLGGPSLGESNTPEDEKDENGKDYPICDGCGRRHKDPYVDPRMEEMRNTTYGIEQVDFSDDPELAAIVTDYQARGGPRIYPTTGAKASAYSPHFDVIGMAAKDLKDKDTRRRITLHEMLHSTGHEKRLNRPAIMFPELKRDVFMEEIIAESGAQMVMTDLGWYNPLVRSITNNYINGYAEPFHKEEGATIGEVRMEAAPAAKAAAEMVLGRPLKVRKVTKARKTATKSPAQSKELVTA